MGGLVAAAVLTVAGSVVLARGVLLRRYGLPKARRGTDLPADDAMGTAQIPGPAGSTLRALVLARPSAVGTALVLHGWGGSALDMLPVGELLREEGLDVVLLDARGHGRSDDVDFTSMPRFAEDLQAAIAWWRSDSGLSNDRLLLVGHSVGAGACLLAARDEPSVDAVVSLACMADPQQVMREILIGAGLPSALTALPLRVVEHLIGQRFSTFAPRQVVQTLTIPLVIVHGQNDASIPVADAAELARCAADAELVVVPDAGHSDAAVVTALRAPLQRLLSGLSTAETAAFPRRAS